MKEIMACAFARSTGEMVAATKPTRAWGRSGLRLLVAGVATSAVVGCATSSLDDYGYAEGWRRAQVLDIVDVQAVTETVFTDCRNALRKAPVPPDRYALTAEGVGAGVRMRDKRIVAVPSGLDLRVGNLVYVNVVDCRPPLRRQPQ